MALICVPSTTVANFLSPNKLIISRKNERSKDEMKSTNREMEIVDSCNNWESL